MKLDELVGLVPMADQNDLAKLAIESVVRQVDGQSIHLALDNASGAASFSELRTLALQFSHPLDPAHKRVG